MELSTSEVMCIEKNDKKSMKEAVYKDVEEIVPMLEAIDELVRVSYKFKLKLQDRLKG